MTAPRTLIATHDGADFDALASQVAARHLYSGAELLLSPSVGRDVHPYLALHRDRFAGHTPAQMEWSTVRRLIVVDVRRRSRLAHLAPLLERRERDARSLELVLYDHHPCYPDDLHGDTEHIARVGSTTTLLTEQLGSAGIRLDVVDATLLALGLHADTGSLCYANTTPRDARALTHLLEQGADPVLCSRYLHRPLDAARRAIVGAVLSATQWHTIAGLTVGIACVPLAQAPSGLDEVTTRAHDSLGCAALFVLYELPRHRLQLIGRSRVSAVDAARVLGALGGGGHASAAAAMLRESDAAGAQQRLLAALREQAPAALNARHLMSSPVHTVTPDTSLRELANELSTWGHSGACVTRGGSVVAVISRTDLRRAELGDQLDRQVKSFMSPRLISTTPEAPLDRVLELMEQHDIGRLPVLESGRLLGIVTRTDVRRALYPERGAIP